MSSEQTIWRNSTHQSVAYTGTAGTISNAVGSNTYAVRIVATSACYYAIAKSPTATSSDVYLPADTVETVRINPGEKVSFLQVASSGTGHVTELA